MESLQESGLVLEQTICDTIGLFAENKSLMIAIAGELVGESAELARKKADKLQKHIDHIVDRLEKKCNKSGGRQ